MESFGWPLENEIIFKKLRMVTNSEHFRPGKIIVEKYAMQSIMQAWTKICMRFRFTPSL